MRRLIAFFALSLSLGLALPALAQVEPPQPPIPAEAAAPTPNQQPLFAAQMCIRDRFMDEVAKIRSSL